MLTISTKPNQAYILHLAEQLLCSRTYHLNDAITLIELVRHSTNINDIHIRLAHFLASKGYKELIKTFISESDIINFAKLSSNPSHIKLALFTLLFLSECNAVLNLLKSPKISNYLTVIDDFDIQIKIADQLIDQREMDKAKMILFGLNVDKIYDHNPDLKDLHARIGWTLYWRSKSYTKVIEWIEKDLFYAGKQPSLHGHPSDRLSPAWRVHYAQALAAHGKILDAERQVEQAYTGSYELKDGYSRVGWAYFSKRKDDSSLSRWMKRDEDQGRLSAAWRLNQAKVLSRLEGMDAALPPIQKAYHENPGLRNAYSQVAWSRYIPKDMAYNKVIPYFEKDLQLGRLHDEWKLNFSRALIIMDREYDAIKYINDAYDKNPFLSNGFAHCGFLRHFVFKYEPDEALKWFELDRKQGRLKQMSLVTHASLLAATGDIESATGMIRHIYNKDSTIKNGHALVGWYYYCLRKHSPSKALPFFELDVHQNRLMPDAGLLYAGVFASLGDCTSAENLVEAYYKKDKNIEGGYFIVGLCNYIYNQNIDYLLNMAEKDLGMGRLSRASFHFLYGLILLKCGYNAKAHSILNKSLENSFLVHSFAKSWLKRVYFAGEKSLEEFFSSEFNEMISHYSTAQNMN